MNDAIRELLSAYLDGALPELERRDVEERLARSEELRAELESLRAVSNAVKGLPRAKLPAGFLARLESRRLREGAPSREYFILPPAYRPVAFALSSAIVAMVVWDRARGPVGPAETARTAWDGAERVAIDRVAIKSGADVPSSMDLSGRLAESKDDSGLLAKKEDLADKPGTAAFGRRAAAPGKPLEVAENPSVAAVRGASADGFGAGAAGAPAAPTASVPDAPAPVAAAEGAFQARTEEERSAMNERLYQNFEQEKKRMGIAQIIEKDSDDDGDARQVAQLSAAPPPATAPRRQRADAKFGAMGGAGAKSKQSEAAPAAKAIALKSSESLLAAWTAAGLAGEPPAVSFPKQMALFLACPAGCGIVDVQVRKRFIVVLYKDAGFADPAARVRPFPVSAKPVVVKRAE